MTARRKSILCDQSGATAVEFALCATVFMAMLLGAFYTSLLGFTSASLHSAVESAARCRSMGITCTDASSTQTFASTQFSNVTGRVPVFAATTASCGNRVTGSVDFHIKWIVGTTTVPLQAAACFPA